MESVGVVIPLRSFAFGKARLARVLDDDARVALSRRMADTVVDAAGSLPIVVVTSAIEVLAWCEERQLAAVADPGSLDTAADAGREWMRERGIARVVVAHADLPYAASFEPVRGVGREAIVVPDQRDDGTPVLSLPVDAPFRFAYGPGSFLRHVAEAERGGLEVRVVRDAALGYDVDTPEDLAPLDIPRR